MENGTQVCRVSKEARTEVPGGREPVIFCEGILSLPELQRPALYRVCGQEILEICSAFTYAKTSESSALTRLLGRANVVPRYTVAIKTRRVLECLEGRLVGGRST